jgi:hypothetical protein
MNCNIKNIPTFLQQAKETTCNVSLQWDQGSGTETEVQGYRKSLRLELLGTKTREKGQEPGLCLIDLRSQSWQ